MSEPTKDNAHILSNQQAFQEAYARAREFFEKIEGVVGVGFGLKETGGQQKDDIAIVVFVREKKNEEDLAPEERIPPMFEGYRTDVRIVGRGTAEVCDNATAYDKIKGGIQIMGKKSSNSKFQGTLGCIVKKRNDRGRENVYLLTNKHVLYSPDYGADESVYHPTPDDKNLGPVQAGGLYGNYSYPIGDPAPQQYFIDCAIARIDLDSKCCCSTCTEDTTEVDETLIVDLQVQGVNSLSDVRSVIDDPTIIHTAANPVKVFKVGRTTGKTTGKVVLINAALDADPEPDKGGPRIAAVNTIQIEFDTATGTNCHGNQRFTEEGDSGSIIVDENNRVIGLHSSRGTAGASGLIPSHACHILPVLDHLSICIPVTTGTSHGSSLATDGSGILPAIVPLPMGDFPMPDGELVFVDQPVEAAGRSLGLTEPVPVSEDEMRHIRELLGAFRNTRTGRELHHVFANIRREMAYLVRNRRPVKVTWHRNKGPAFLAHVLNHLKGQSERVPREVEGISLAMLLGRMGEVLSKHGSNPLREAIEKHSDDMLSMLTSGACTVQDCIAYLQQKETA
jgi:hypothetical protein